MNTLTQPQSNSLLVPVAGLTIFAVASGYLMSLLPLALVHFHMDSSFASWLASVYYLGLLMGSLLIEPIIARMGHRIAFISFLGTLALTIVALPLFPNKEMWLLTRFIAGIAVAGVFVVIESWLLIGNKKERAFRLGLYMTALYGGTTLGQFGIGAFGTQGFEPFIVIFVLIIAAILPPLFVKQGQPNSHSHQTMPFKKILTLSKPAMIGCLVSGIVMGSIYGLMPLALKYSGISNNRTGYLMAAVVLGGMLIQPVISLLSTRMNKSLLLAMMCLLGVFAMGLIFLSNSYSVLVVALTLLGMASFALYPIAITLACDELDSSFIVAATQVMLFCYSVGSACGPLVANQFLTKTNGLMGFFFIVLLSTCIYMLLASLKRKAPVIAK